MTVPPDVPRSGATIPETSRRRRIAPVLALMALAPWAAECSWGGFVVTDYLLVVIFLGPLYGGAAVLIREAARRTGAGWPAIVLLAAAFGVYQAGLVDQALFNQGFLDDTEFAELTGDAASTLVPGLRFSAAEALNYVGNHIALSICAPIAIVESFLGQRRRREAWLGNRGLAVVGVLFVLGSLLIFQDSADGRKGFLAAPLQLGFAVSLVLALTGAAILPRWRRARLPVDAQVPHPIWVGAVTVGAGATADLVPGWGGLCLRVAAIAVAAVLVVRWSRRIGWGQRHVVAAWAGTLTLAAAGAYVVPNYKPASPAEALIGDITISVITVGLLVGAYWRLHATLDESVSPGPVVSTDAAAPSAD